MKHEIAMDKMTMTYSWYIISNNNTIIQVKYSNDGGNTFHTINFMAGAYSYSDIDYYIHKHMDNVGQKTGETYHINITFVLSASRVVIEVGNSYWLDLRNTAFGDLLGFDKKN